jgi:hypothetical protein
LGFDYPYNPITFPLLDFQLRPSLIILGMLKKAASGVPCLRRSGYAQAGRPFAVLTYRVYAPRVKMAAALLDGLF